MVLLASAYDQSRFLRAEDLPAERKFRVKAITEEEVGEKRERKLVVWFTNDKRGLVLNKTNNRTIRGAFGDDCSGWINKIIIVFPTTAELRGKLVPALRVRIPPPKQATGNGQSQAAAKPAPAEPPPPPAAVSVDPELDDGPRKSLGDELDDEISF
jgi:hypothetical protein